MTGKRVIILIYNNFIIKITEIKVINNNDRDLEFIPSNIKLNFVYLNQINKDVKIDFLYFNRDFLRTKKKKTKIMTAYIFIKFKHV
jgi:hypothetical protein